MGMVKVYRFEDMEGVGPFRNGADAAYDDAQRTRNPFHSCRHMPSPYSPTEVGTELQSKHNGDEALRGGEFDKYFFGFLNLNQLKQAFRSPKGREAMASRGVRLAVYEAQPMHVLSGAYQCAFVKREATLKGYLDLKTLKPLL